MDRQDALFVTFSNKAQVSDLEGKDVIYKELLLHFDVCDRIVIKLKVHWLPLWVSNEDVNRILAKYGEVRKVEHVTENGIITGVRQAELSLREGEQRDIPYISHMYGNKCLIVIPGRPPVCFKCEEVGHLRGECTTFRYGRPPTRSYASVAQTKEAVGKPQAEAVGKPQECVPDNKAVGKPETVEEVVGIPQQDETEAVGMPIDEDEQASVSKLPDDDEQSQGTVGKSSENEKIGQQGDDVCEQSSELVAATPVTPRESQWIDAAVETVMNILDEDDSLGTETKRARVEYDFPESPGALELSRADRR